MLKYHDRGFIPRRAPTITDGLFAIIKDCWKQNPAHRPEFSHVINKIIFEKKFPSIMQTKENNLFLIPFRTIQERITEQMEERHKYKKNRIYFKK